MQIAVLAFDHIAAVDAVGACGVLGRLPDVDTVVVGERRGPVSCETDGLTLVVEATLDDVRSPDVVVVPGWAGGTNDDLLRPGPVRTWLQAADEHSTWTAAVGTGALVLAAAGLLTGRRATTHWLAVDRLAELGALPSDGGVVHDGKYLTAAGLSGGIDLGLTLAANIAGPETAKAIQLLVQYDPQPPFHAGSVERAPAELVSSMRALRDFILDGRPRRASEGSRPMPGDTP